MNKVKTALITGASSGLGREFALIFAQNGCDIVLCSRRSDELFSLAGEIETRYNVKVWVKSKDLSIISEVQALYDDLQHEQVHVDFLVNNAGFGEYGFFHEINWSRQEDMINLNVMALTKLSYLFSRPMIERGFGKILQVSSVAAFMPGPTMAVYYATKAFVQSLSEAMAVELKGTGVSVTSLCPGPTQTNFARNAHLEHLKIFNNGLIPQASDVAKFGYQQMMESRISAVHGLFNKLSAFSVRFVPRSTSAKMVKYIQEKKIS